MPLALPDFNLDEDRREFRDTLRRFFEDQSPITEVRRVTEAGEGIAASVWKEACRDLGIAGIAIPESCGGQGFGPREMAIAMGEVGRGLVPIPLFSSAVLAAGAVTAACGAGADADAAQWLGPIAEGQIASLAWVEAAGSWSLAETSLTAESSAVDGEARLEGSKYFVADGRSADRLFVVARAPGSVGFDGLSLFAVEGDDPGLAIRPCETLDATRPVAVVELKGAKGRRVGAADAGAALDHGLCEATALLCAEMVGGMQKLIETAVDYAAERHQFSRPIGSFQAIKHKCADLLIDFEGARTAMDGAITALEDGDAERDLLAAVAKAHVGPAYVRMAIENMQIQGGVGYTWEYDAHLYYRRALGSAEWLGAAPDQHDWIARRVARSIEDDRRTAVSR